MPDAVRLIIRMGVSSPDDRPERLDTDMPAAAAMVSAATLPKMGTAMAICPSVIVTTRESSSSLIEGLTGTHMYQ